MNVGPPKTSFCPPLRFMIWVCRENTSEKVMHFSLLDAMLWMFFYSKFVEGASTLLSKQLLTSSLIFNIFSLIFVSLRLNCFHTLSLSSVSYICPKGGKVVFIGDASRALFQDYFSLLHIDPRCHKKMKWCFIIFHIFFNYFV